MVLSLPTYDGSASILLVPETLCDGEESLHIHVDANNPCCNLGHPEMQKLLMFISNRTTFVCHNPWLFALLQDKCSGGKAGRPWADSSSALNAVFGGQQCNKKRIKRITRIYAILIISIYDNPCNLCNPLSAPKAPMVWENVDVSAKRPVPRCLLHYDFLSVLDVDTFLRGRVHTLAVERIPVT